jgi:iron complex outermembrane receptor protein
MKKILTLIILTIFLFANLIHGQQESNEKNNFSNHLSIKSTLSGKVTDAQTGSPLSGANIYIHDINIKVATKENGSFQTISFPSGNYIVEVSFVGYKTISENILITGDTHHDFILGESYVEGNEVVVTGLSKAAQIKKSPIPIVAINHSFILSNVSTNIIDAVTKVPGITAVTTGPNISKPFIRGLGYNRILTLYDGIRQEGQQWGDEHGIEVDQHGIEKIEIVKGPASLTYGSDALAGVVNLIPTQPAPEKKIIGDILSEYQTNNGMFAGSGMLSGTKNGIEWIGRISHKQATNYQNKFDGRVYGTSFKENDASMYLGVHRQWGFSHLSFSLFDDLQKIPDGSRDSASRKFTKQITEIDTVRDIVSDEELKSYKITGTHQHIQHYRLFSSNSFLFGTARLTLNLGFQRSVRREFSHPELLNIPGLFLQLNTYNYDVKYFFPENNGWNISLGVNGMYQKNTVTKGTDFVIPSYHQFDFGPFAVAKKTIGKLDISGGVRFDTRSFTSDQLYTKPAPVTGFDMPVTDTAGADYHFSHLTHTYTGFSGSIGGTYNISDKVYFKANISRGFRAPNIAEISANGVHPGTNIYQIGGASFKPEFSTQEDIGFVYSSKMLVINLSVFNNDINNYIYNQKLLAANGSDSVIIQGNQTFKFQQGNANLYGGELNFDVHPVKQLHFENSFSLVYGRNKNIGKFNDSAKYLPFIPPFHGMSELRYDFNSKTSHIKNGFIKAQVVYYAAQKRTYIADNTETLTPGYTLFNIGAGAGLTDKNRKTIFTLYIMANNLFNVSYQDHLSRLKYFEQFPGNFTGRNGIFNMGRNISFKVDVPLDFKIK